MFTNVLILVVAFFVLVHGAEYFVRGASSVARKFGVSMFVVGLTIVSIGTSAPELFVNVIAALQGSTDISISNILGSNLADILLGLGIAAIIVPLSIKEGTVWKEIPFALLAVVFIFIFGSDVLFNGGVVNEITRSEGLALLGFFVVFIVYTFGLKSKEPESPEERVTQYSWVISSFYILGGMIALFIGGKFAVSSAVALASSWGISENLIGLTIVAAGTSLPDIAIAIIAARKGHIDMVVGGIIGSIIFNALFVLGVTSMVRPLPFSAHNVTDTLVLIMVTLSLFAFMFVGDKHVIRKWQGWAFVMIYIAYIAWAVMRG